MIKTISMVAVAVLLTACGADTISESVSGNSGSNSTTLDTSNLTSIVLKTTTNNVGPTETYYAVTAFIDGPTGNNTFSHNSNYVGTVTTTCIQASITTTAAQYDCTTVYNQTTPLGTPANSTRTVTFLLGQTYRVYQQQGRLTTSNVITEVGTITIP